MKATFSTLIFFVFLILFTTCCKDPEPVKELSDIKIEKEYSLPLEYFDYITCITSDNKGNIIVGTEAGGVYWQRGESFELLLPDRKLDTSRVSKMSINSMAVDTHNKLWITTNYRGVFTNDNKDSTSWKNISYENGLLKYRSAKQIIVNNNNIVSFVNYSHNSSSFYASELVKYDGTSLKFGIESNEKLPLSLWKSDGLYKNSEGEPVYLISENTSVWHAKRYFIGKKNGVDFITDINKQYSLSDSTIVGGAKTNGLYDCAINYNSKSNILAFPVLLGILKYGLVIDYGGTNKLIYIKNDSINNFKDIGQLCVDNQGDIWMTLDKYYSMAANKFDLRLYTNKKWINFNDPANRSFYYNKIIMTPDGSIWTHSTKDIIKLTKIYR